MDEDYLKQTQDLIQNTFLEIVDVLDKAITDPELKKKAFEEMQNNFDTNLGGMFKK